MYRAALAEGTLLTTSEAPDGLDTSPISSVKVGTEHKMSSIEYISDTEQAEKESEAFSEQGESKTLSDVEHDAQMKEQENTDPVAKKRACKGRKKPKPGKKKLKINGAERAQPSENEPLLINRKTQKQSVKSHVIASGDSDWLRIDTVQQSNEIRTDSLPRTTASPRATRPHRSTSPKYHHPNTEKSTEAFVRRMRAPQMGRGSSFSSANELSWSKTNQRGSTAYERDLIDHNHRAFHRCYGSPQVIRPAQMEYLDYHSAKLEDKYRELKELVTVNHRQEQDDTLLHYTNGVMRSMKLVQSGVVPTPVKAGSYRPKTSLAGRRRKSPGSTHSARSDTTEMGTQTDADDTDGDELGVKQRRRLRGSSRSPSSSTSRSRSSSGSSRSNLRHRDTARESDTERSKKSFIMTIDLTRDEKERHVNFRAPEDGESSPDNADVDNVEREGAPQSLHTRGRRGRKVPARGQSWDSERSSYYSSSDSASPSRSRSRDNAYVDSRLSTSANMDVLNWLKCKDTELRKKRKEERRKKREEKKIQEEKEKAKTEKKYVSMTLVQDWMKTKQRDHRRLLRKQRKGKAKLHIMATSPQRRAQSLDNVVLEGSPVTMEARASMVADGKEINETDISCQGTEKPADLHGNQETPRVADCLHKVLVVGSTGTGKSCIVQQFIQGTFNKDSNETIGVDFGSKVVNVEGKRVKLQIWDASGQERFIPLTRNYYRDSTAVLLVYDITSRETYTALPSWLTDARALASPDAVITLVGNKKDLESERQVTFLEASGFAQENGLLFMETSALTGDNVEETYLKCARSILAKVESVPLKRPHSAKRKSRKGERVDLSACHETCTCGYVDTQKQQEEHLKHTRMLAKLRSVQTQRSRQAEKGKREPLRPSTATVAFSGTPSPPNRSNSLPNIAKAKRPVSADRRSKAHQQKDDAERQKRLSYDAWIKRKHTESKKKKTEEKQKLEELANSTDPEDKEIIQTVARNRIDKIMRGKKRIDTGIPQVDNEANQSTEERIQSNKQRRKRPQSAPTQRTTNENADSETRSATEHRNLSSIDTQNENQQPTKSTNEDRYSWKETDKLKVENSPKSGRPSSARPASAKRGPQHKSKRPSSAKADLYTKHGRVSSADNGHGGNHSNPFKLPHPPPPRKHSRHSPKPSTKTTHAYRKVAREQKSWDEFGQFMWDDVNKDADKMYGDTPRPEPMGAADDDVFVKAPSVGESNKTPTSNGEGGKITQEVHTEITQNENKTDDSPRSSNHNAAQVPTSPRAQDLTTSQKVEDVPASPKAQEIHTSPRETETNGIVKPEAPSDDVTVSSTNENREDNLETETESRGNLETKSEWSPTAAELDLLQMISGADDSNGITTLFDEIQESVEKEIQEKEEAIEEILGGLGEPEHVEPLDLSEINARYDAKQRVLASPPGSENDHIEKSEKEQKKKQKKEKSVRFNEEVRVEEFIDESDPYYYEDDFDDVGDNSGDFAGEYVSLDLPSPVGGGAVEGDNGGDGNVLTGAITVSMEANTVANAQNTVSTEQTTVSAEQTTVSAEQTTVSVEQTTVSVKQPTGSTEQTTVSAEQTTVSTEEARQEDTSPQAENPSTATNQ